MPKPALPDSEKRRHKVELSLNDAELEMLEAARERAGVTDGRGTGLAKWARDVLLRAARRSR